AELKRLRQLKDTSPPTLSKGPADRSEDVSVVHVARGLLTGLFSNPVGEAASFAPSPASPTTSPSSSSVSESIHLPGQTDATTLTESGRQYWQSVARVGAQRAAAPQHAHGQGVLHRDSKPSNLLLDEHGNVWVTDFGLAKAASDGEDLTHSGDVVGTLRYLAPERFGGKGDARSDLYSLGLTLYEMLTLRPAFAEVNRHQLIPQVIHGEP